MEEQGSITSHQPTSSLTPGPLGIIAGNGSLPLALINQLKAKGRQVFVAAHREETSPLAFDAADGATWVAVGALSKIINFFHFNEVREIVFIGGIRKARVLNALFDSRTRRILSTLASFNDDQLLRAIISEFEREGFRVSSAAQYLSSLIVAEGSLTQQKLSSEQKEAALIGWECASQLGAADVGQTVVVKQKTVVAVEAIEGTDAAIRRGVSLGGEGRIVVKRCKPNQDTRVDLPTIGKETIELLIELKVSGLVLEAGKAFLVDADDAIAEANLHGIVIEGWRA